MRVIIESPFAGGWQNVLYARECVLDSLSRGESPYASHLLYAQKGMLDDKNPIERERGIAAADGWLQVADYVAVYCDRGITTGMLIGVIKGARLGKPFRLRWLLSDQKEMILEGNQDERNRSGNPTSPLRGGEVVDLQRLGLLRDLGSLRCDPVSAGQPDPGDL